MEEGCNRSVTIDIGMNFRQIALKTEKGNSRWDETTSEHLSDLGELE